MGNWICFNFKNEKINPTSYQLNFSYNYNIEEDEEEEEANNCLSSWCVEGLNDKNNWGKNR